MEEENVYRVQRKVGMEIRRIVWDGVEVQRGRGDTFQRNNYLVVVKVLKGEVVRVEIGVVGDSWVVEDFECWSKTIGFQFVYERK